MTRTRRHSHGTQRSEPPRDRPIPPAALETYVLHDFGEVTQSILHVVSATSQRILTGARERMSVRAALVIRSSFMNTKRTPRVSGDPRRSLHELRGFVCILGFTCAALGGAGCKASREAAPPAPESALAQPGAGGSAAHDTQVAASGNQGRKIVRQAELELEVSSASSAQTEIEETTERHGGYVVSANRDTAHESAVDVRVELVVRVPQGELTSTIAEVKRLGRGIGSERITSDDVTDEYIDLSARSSSQQKLELQYLEILRRAATVKDALEVEKQLGEVRTEIERLQGRAQLLEKESAYSTLTVHLSTAVPRIAVGRALGDTLRRSWRDSLAFSADLLEAGIHLAAYLVPLALLLGLPSVFAIWLLVRLARHFTARTRRLSEPAE